MSNIRSLEISLSELVEQSNLVVEVAFESHATEPVPPNARDLESVNASAAPPFLKKARVFRVLHTFKNTTGIVVPATLTIPDENWRRDYNDYREKYFKATPKNYTISEYNTDVSSIEKAAVLFLTYFQNTFELTARNGFEDAAGIEKVTILAAKKTYKK